MRPNRAFLIFLLPFVLWPASGLSQVRSEDDVQAYLEAVGRFYGVGVEEVRILRDWRLPTEEVPVLLFIAGKAGVSPDAIAANRLRGSSWNSLARAYGVQTADAHVAFGSGTPLGELGPLYDRFRSTPRSGWNVLELSDRDYISLVNVKALSRELRVPPGRVLQSAQDQGGFVAAYRELGGG